MLNMLPKEVFSDPGARWLDPGAGTGHFSIILYHRLMVGLEAVIPVSAERHKHIIQNMLYMVELKFSSAEKLRTIFGQEAHVFEEDFTSIELKCDFDYVIGNPPYNANGMKKVPTNSHRKKKDDGRTIWIPFVKKAVSLLKDGGRLLFIIPSIWMKPDKAGMYQFMTSFKLEKIRCLTNTETNRLFHGEAQTPTSCFILRKQNSNRWVELYDKDRKAYISYRIRQNTPIPIYGATILKKLAPYVRKAGMLKVKKTNMPSTLVKISPYPTPECTHLNIKTCLLHDLNPTIIINYSDKELAFTGKSKLVLAHKMYGFPYLDGEGRFGISNRDNYVITDRPLEELQRLRDFLSTRTALYLFEATRYRMKYLERYIFELIPDITKFLDFPDIITDESIGKYFKFDSDDLESIRTLHRRKYVFSPTLSIAQN